MSELKRKGFFSFTRILKCWREPGLKERKGGDVHAVLSLSVRKITKLLIRAHYDDASLGINRLSLVGSFLKRSRNICENFRYGESSSIVLNNRCDHLLVYITYIHAIFVVKYFYLRRSETKNPKKISERKWIVRVADKRTLKAPYSDRSSKALSLSSNLIPLCLKVFKITAGNRLSRSVAAAARVLGD